mgnify:CR=1 FL=1
MASKNKVVIKTKTVPGGGRWTCTRCGKSLLPGMRIATEGSKRYCETCMQVGKEAVKPEPEPKLLIKRRPARGQARSSYSKTKR